MLNKTRALVALPAVAGSAIVASPAFAAGTIADLSSAVDFTETKTAMVAIAVLGIAVVVLWRGIQYVRRATSGS